MNQYDNEIERQNVIKRFYIMLDALVEAKFLRGKQTYCKLYNINRFNLNTQSKNLNRGYFKVDWIIPLVKDFGVNGNWLLTGEGKPFSKKKIKGKSLDTVIITE